MPRRQIYLIVWVTIGSLICFQRANGRYLPFADRFVEVLGYVDREFVSPVTPEELLSGALEGMVGQLDDYSGYIGPEEFQEMEESLNQEFGGIGIQVAADQVDGRLTVLSPLVGTPAYEAGIIAGDVIVAINGESTAALSMDDAVLRLRGAPGTEVKVAVERAGEEEPREFKLVRENIVVDTVLGDTYDADDHWNFFLPGDERIAYIRITSFGQRTADELETVIGELSRAGMRGLVLDLRNNPGGLLDVAIDVCDLFIESGTIVSTRERNGGGETWEAQRDGTYSGFPIVVLVNHFSASASEIVAACLQDHGRAAVVGERTWGKGSVQSVVELDDRRSAVKLTVATYWRPSGKNIHKGRNAKDTDSWGVMPSPGLEVKLSDDEAEKLFLARRNRDVIGKGTAAPPIDDRQLQRALEYLREQLQSTKTASRS
ncbi:MAG: S41 family peptidase [Pirellulales bacterium]|nr:S41 family peptidase [Pirellulales bacterium]